MTTRRRRGPFLACQRLDGQVVDGTYDIRLTQAVGKHVVTVENSLRLIEASEHRFARDVVQELIAPGHGCEKGAKLEICDQVLRLGGNPSRNTTS